MTSIDLLNRSLPIRLAPSDVVAFANRGNAYYARGDYERALADFDAVVKLRPNDARALVNRGLARYGRRDYDGAIADYSAAIARDPANASAFRDRALAYSASDPPDL